MPDPTLSSLLVGFALSLVAWPLLRRSAFSPTPPRPSLPPSQWILFGAALPTLLAPVAISLLVALPHLIELLATPAAFLTPLMAPAVVALCLMPVPAFFIAGVVTRSDRSITEALTHGLLHATIPVAALSMCLALLLGAFFVH